VKVEQAVQDTIVATRIVDGFKNPQGAGGSGGGYLKDHAGFPLEYVVVLDSVLTSLFTPNRYFSRVTEQMKERLAWYKSTIEVRP
jgi:nucleoporin p58/p45